MCLFFFLTILIPFGFHVNRLLFAWPPLSPKVGRNSGLSQRAARCNATLSGKKQREEEGRISQKPLTSTYSSWTSVIIYADHPLRIAVLYTFTFFTSQQLNLSICKVGIMY